MLQTQNTKRYDLAERTRNFAKEVIRYVRLLPKSISNIEIGKQLVRSSGSTGANYIEAEESLSKKDFVHRIKIVRKEAKESQYWLDLSDPQNDQVNIKGKLMQESLELTKIFGSIVDKSQ
ncbi:MAG: four helix bundle protein [Candidatus Omnitrophota bacterium]|nr:four helix bundle protein [Candidatus Omnitrophota bacterium]